MKIMVIYDSVYGNTEKVARAISEVLSGGEEVELVPAADVEVSDLTRMNLVVIGAPTHGGRPSEDVKELLDEIPIDGLEGVRVAAFDTRTDVSGKNIFIRAIAGILSYAGGRIEKTLVRKGGNVVADAEGFLVNDREGPLIDGELDRARNWAGRILSGAS